MYYLGFWRKVFILKKRCLFNSQGGIIMVFEKRMTVKDLIEQMRQELQDEKEAEDAMHKRTTPAKKSKKKATKAAKPKKKAKKIVKKKRK